MYGSRQPGIEWRAAARCRSTANLLEACKLSGSTLVPRLNLQACGILALPGGTLTDAQAHEPAGAPRHHYKRVDGKMHGAQQCLQAGLPQARRPRCAAWPHAPQRGTWHLNSKVHVCIACGPNLREHAPRVWAPAPFGHQYLYICMWPPGSCQGPRGTGRGAHVHVHIHVHPGACCLAAWPPQLAVPHLRSTSAAKLE